MKCGYCGKEIGDENHYCIQGRDFIVAENIRLREKTKRLVLAARRAEMWIRQNHQMPGYSELLLNLDEALAAFDGEFEEGK